MIKTEQNSRVVFVIRPLQQEVSGKLVAYHFCRDAWFSSMGQCDYAMHGILSNEGTLQWQSSPSFAALGRVERVFDDSVLHGSREASTVQMPSVCVKWFCAHTGGNLGFFPACIIVTSRRGESADEIGGRLSHQEQTVGHHLHRVAVLTEKLWESGARQIKRRQCNTPAVWLRISSFCILKFTQLWLLVSHSWLKSIIKILFPLNTFQCHVKDKSWGHVIFSYPETNSTDVHRHLLNIDKGSSSLLSTLLDLRVPLAAVSEQYCWH